MASARRRRLVVTAQPGVFGPAGSQLFGFYHPPKGKPQPTGVVLCNPLGYEAMCTHRTYRHAAERAAAHGFPALRFDYEGTGDSSGAPVVPGRMGAWKDSIDLAIAELRARSGCENVILLGVRFGGTLAALTAMDRQDVAGLVLWAPCPSGRAYVREMRAFRMLKDEGAAPRLDGDEEVAGYLFDKETVASMGRVDLLAARASPAKRVLILPRDRASSEARLAAHLGSLGAAVTVADDGGYAEMMRDPQDTIVPTATLDALVAWLAASGDVAAAHDHEAAAASPAAREPLVTTTHGERGVEIRETPVLFGDDDRLFGIVTEPTVREVLPGSPAILFLNVGANHRVGPNRMYVTIARELAALGYLCMRFDVAGLGDSRLAQGAAENRLYSKDSVGDVKTAMELLGRTRKVGRFVLVGLCSGAYLAFHTAVEDARVAGQVLLNPQTFEWKEGDTLELSIRKSFKSTRFYARALLDPAVWRRAATGSVHVRAIASALRERLVAKAEASAESLRARLRGRAQPQTDIERAFVAMSDRGVAQLLVFSFSDGGLDMIEKHLGRNVKKMAGRTNFSFEIVEGADHTFTPIGSQRALRDIVTRYVTGSFR